MFPVLSLPFSSVIGLSAAWKILRNLRILRNFVRRLAGFRSLRSAASKARVPLLELVADQLAYVTNLGYRLPRSLKAQLHTRSVVRASGVDVEQDRQDVPTTPTVQN